MRRMLLVIALAVIPTSLTAQFNPAPAYKTDGLLLGLAANGTSIGGDDFEDAEAGAGLSLRLGYGFTPAIGIFLQATGANIQIADGGGDSYALVHGDIGARFNVLPGRRINPFVEGAIGGRQFTYQVPELGDLELRGAAYTLGGGAEIFLAQTVAVEIGLDYSVGDFNEGRLGGEWEDLGGDISANSARFNLGLNWHP